MIVRRRRGEAPLERRIRPNLHVRASSAQLRPRSRILAACSLSGAYYRAIARGINERNFAFNSINDRAIGTRASRPLKIISREFAARVSVPGSRNGENDAFQRVEESVLKTREARRSSPLDY